MREWVPYNKNQVMWELLNSPGKAFEIRAGRETPWDLQMRLVERELMPGPGISSNWDEYLMQAIFQKGRAYIQYSDGFRISYDPSNLLRLVPSFEIVGRYLPPKSKSRRKGIRNDQKSSGVFYYKFGSVVTADIAGLALYLFGKVNSYTIGQAYSWNNQNEYSPVEAEKGELDFDLDDFTAAGRHYNIKGGVQGAVFYNERGGLMNGLKELREHFPKANSQDIRDLYYKFSMEPSSQIGRFFPRAESTGSKRTQRRKPKPINDLDLIQYIGRHHIRKSKRSLFLWSNELDSEVAVKNPFELVQTIRANGDNIEAGMGPKIWEEVTGKAWKSKGEADEQ